MTRSAHFSRGGAQLAGEGPGGARRRAESIGGLLRDALGDAQVADDLWERRLYDHDIAPTLSVLELMYRTIPDAVVRPRTAADVQTLLGLANEHRFPVIPRGAATWGLGGAVPSGGGVVLDLTSLGRVLETNAGEMTVNVEAGAVWQDVIRAALRKGIHIGTYPSSYPSATVGGWIGVGGVGIGTCRYGRIGQNLAALEVVLPDGSLIEPGRPGSPLLVGSFVGSEGIMGVVTKAVIRAVPLPERIRPVSFAFPTLGAAGPFLERLGGEGEAPEHVMFADRANFELLRTAGIETGVESALVTVVLAGTAASVEGNEGALEGLARSLGGGRAPDEVAEREWRERSCEFRMRRAGTGSLPGEVVVPLSRWREAMEGTNRLVKLHRLNAAVIGTLADRGSFMLMPYYLLDERRELRTLAAMTFNFRLAELALRLGGTPVGLGIYFSFLLEKMHRAPEVRRLRELKARLDPNCILNPGKMLEARTRLGTRIPVGSSVLMMKLLGMLRSRMVPEPMDRPGPGFRLERVGRP